MALSRIVKIGTLAAVTLAIGTAMSGCDEQEKGKQAPAKPADSAGKQEPGKAPAAEPKKELDIVKVTIGGKVFKLELAADDQTRFKGLSDRTEIKADGGMLFVFKEPRMQNFVMRDCLVPIDIIYLDASGRVTATHKMPIEKPREPDEVEKSPPRDAKGQAYPNIPRWAWVNDKYEERLKQFSSRYPAQYVIELKGNTLDDLKIKEGDKIELDRADLKKRAK